MGQNGATQTLPVASEACWRHEAPGGRCSLAPSWSSCSVRSSEAARAWVRLVNSCGVALRHTREGDEKDIRDRARVEYVVHLARSLDERLPRAVRHARALAALGLVNGERARLDDHNRATRMRVPARRAAHVDRDLRHRYVRSKWKRDGPV